MADFRLSAVAKVVCSSPLSPSAVSLLVRRAHHAALRASPHTPVRRPQLLTRSHVAHHVKDSGGRTKAGSRSPHCSLHTHTHRTNCDTTHKSGARRDPAPHATPHPLWTLRDLRTAQLMRRSMTIGCHGSWKMSCVLSSVRGRRAKSAPRATARGPAAGGPCGTYCRGLMPWPCGLCGTVRYGPECRAV